MSKKQLDTGSISNELTGASVYFREPQTKPKRRKQKRKVAHKVAQNVEQKTEQVSKVLLKPLSKSLKTEDIELLAFELRKVRKVKVNTEVPEAWKDKLDTMAYQLKVGKYDLVMYIIGLYLGEVKSKK